MRRLRLEPLESRDLLATIQGVLFDDIDGSGTRDLGEPDLAVGGVTVYLDQNTNGVLDAGEVSSTTAADGTYEFTGLAAGTYHVAQLAPSGYRQTSPSPTPGPGKFGEVLGFIDADPGLFPNSGAGPRGIAYVDGLLHVHAAQTSTSEYVINRFDPVTGALVSQIGAPHDFYDITHDGTDYWGSGQGAGLMRFNDAGTVLQTIPSISNSLGVAWDGNSLWVSTRDDLILQVDPNSGAVLDSFTAPNVGAERFYGLGYDGEHLWVVRDNHLYEVDTSTGETIRSLEAPHNGSPEDGAAKAVSVAFDGQAMWITQHDDHMLIRMDVSTPGTVSVAVDAGDVVSGVDFGNFAEATIQGVVFEDSDSDGVQDASEIGLAGWRVFLDANQNGDWEAWEANSITDAQGAYSLTADAPGAHHVAALLRQPGWEATLPVGGAQSLIINSSGETASVDFGHVLNGVGPVGPELDITPHLANPFLIDVASDANGGFATLWSENGTGSVGLWVTLFDSFGNKISEEILIKEGVGWGHLAMADDGRFVVVWGNRGQVFAANGTRIGAEIPIDGNLGAKESLVVTGVDMNATGEIAVLALVTKDVGKNSSRLKVQRLDAAGQISGSLIDVSEENGNGHQDIAIDAAGNIVVSWSDFGVYAQRIDASGNLVGSTINVDPSGNRSSLAMSEDGRFVVTWDNQFAQVFNADGTPSGAVVQFNNDLGSGFYAGVGMDADGNVVVAYAASEAPKDGLFLGRRIDAAGNLSGDEFQINTTRELFGYQSNKLSVASDGSYVAVWRSENSRVFRAQVFSDATPAPPAPTFSIDDVTVTEGDGGQTSATFTVTRSGEVGVAASVEVSTADDSATIADNDYVAVPPTLLEFAANETQKTVTVLVNGDTSEEPDETFLVNLSNPSAGTEIADGQGLGTILSDDVPPIAYSIYVWDIEFDSRDRGSKHDERVTVTVRLDSDADGIAEASDELVSEANVTVVVTNSAGEFVEAFNYAATDRGGQVVTGWMRDLADDTYTAEVTWLSHPTYFWNQDLDPTANDGDSDGDGLPDQQHTVPDDHLLAAALTMQATTLDSDLSTDTVVSEWSEPIATSQPENSSPAPPATSDSDAGFRAARTRDRVFADFAETSLEEEMLEKLAIDLRQQ